MSDDLRWLPALMLLTVSRPAMADTWWLVPLDRAAVTGSAFDEQSRPYNTPLHPRFLVGNIAASCEHIEGRPCGDGATVYAELDSRAGYGHVLQLTTRLRTQAGSHFEDNALVDRMHLDLQLDHFSAEIGRDVVHIGPSARTSLSWADHPPPLDQMRVGASVHRASAVYLIGRLRDPQRFPGTLVTIGRGQLALGKIDLGIVQMMQVEGEGARHLGIVDFILEHFRRKDISAMESDSSNRRFGGDISAQIPELRLRLYYMLVFEDIRKARVIDAIRYDADHLLGGETPWFTVEYQETAARSQEHTSRTTGFTNGGYAVGSPLGPDARSLYIAGRIGNLTPWIELAQLRNRQLQYFDHGPITPISEGEDEGRYRIGVMADVPLRRSTRLEAQALFEHVDDFAFEPHATRNNYGLRVTLAWLPRL